MSAEERRSKNKLQDEEDASLLKLGDFMESDCLSISEVKALLETLTKTRLMNGIKMNDTSVYKKTQEYVGNFARFTTQESISAVREITGRGNQLTDFEKTQIANLCPTESEEAKALIPSLTDKIDDDDLQTMLSEISQLRRFQD